MYHENFYPDAQILSLVNTFEKTKGLEGDILEIGCWEGKSTVNLANACYPEKLIAVDHWLGSSGEENSTVKIAKIRNVYEDFCHNINRMTQGNLLVFKEDCFDFLGRYKGKVKFCHIDACHRYEDVKRTIELLMDKVVPNGILCGDDFINAHKNRHDLNGGVERAVEEFLKGFKSIHNFWYWENKNGKGQ